MKSASEVRVTMGETGYLSEKTVADYSDRIIWPQIEAAARAGRYGVNVNLGRMSSREVKLIKSYLEDLEYWVDIYEDLRGIIERNLIIAWT